MIRGRLGVGVLVLLLGLAGWAQEDSLQSAGQRLRAQAAAGVRFEFRATGAACGSVMQLTAANQTAAPVRLEFLPGLVLESGGETQNFVLGTLQSLELAPGASGQVDLTGFCLNYEKDPPAQGPAPGYHWASQPETYARAARLVRTAQALARDGRFHPRLDPEQQLVIVTQRALWADLTRGWEHPYTLETLEEDIRAEVRDRLQARKGDLSRQPATVGAGNPELGGPEDAEVRELARDLWQDVQLLLRETGSP